MDAGQQLLDAGVDQRQVEVELAGEVLVQDRLADGRAVGDVVHGRRVEPLGDEHVLRGAQELQPAGAPGQPGKPR